MPIDQDSKLNLAKVDERMYRKVTDNILWKDMIGLQQDAGRDDNGQKKYRASGKIIEKSTTPINFNDGVDHGILTMENDLVGDAFYGDTKVAGAGEEWDWNHMRVHVCQTRKPVKVKSGNMSELRGNRYNIRERARPKLQNWFVEEKNANYTQAIYEGASRNLTTGLDVAKNGIGLSARFPSNAYYLGSSGTYTAIGTAGYNKSKANFDTASAAAKVTLDNKSIDAAALLCQELKIGQGAKYKGKPMWVWVISPYILHQLRQDTTWLASERAFTNGKRSGESPLIDGAVNAYMGFIFKVDMLAVRPWNSTLQDFAGANGWRARGTYNTAAGHEVNDCTYILGKGALAVSEPTKYSVKEEASDFESDIEVAGSIIDGIERVDFVSSSDESVFFAKGKDDFTVYETAKEVINNQLLMLMLDRV
ncbi:MAG: DUF4043 family protein [Nanoarchaeota archaeon]|nr:DUF4043 family protein [Nanoarchaeota archaeon]